MKCETKNPPRSAKPQQGGADKNTGPFLTFDELWFRKHQRILIRLLNMPIIKIWFRWVLRIRRCDCRLDEKINLILPNQFHRNARVEGDKIFATADFRTHWKYSKRIYHAFKWVWWTLHFWDWLIADRFLPELSFGLFTLTRSPDIGNGFVSCDGVISRSLGDSAFTINNASENSSLADYRYVSTTGGFIPFAHTTDGTTTSPRIVSYFMKSFFFFDTSSLGAASIIDTATMSLWVYDYDSISEKGLGDVGLFAATTSYNNNLAASDYFGVANTLLANILPVNPTLISYYDGLYPGIVFYKYYAAPDSYLGFTLNTDGKNNVNKTGVSKFATRWTLSSISISSTDPHNWSMVRGYSADNDGLTKDPKLVIEYSIPSTNKIQMII